MKHAQTNYTVAQVVGLLNYGSNLAKLKSKNGLYCLDGLHKLFQRTIYNFTEKEYMTTFAPRVWLREPTRCPYSYIDGKYYVDKTAVPLYLGFINAELSSGFLEAKTEEVECES